jgi:hypothetical protein
MTIVERLARISAHRLIELLIFSRVEPRAIRDLALCPVGRRQVRQIFQPALPDGGFKNLPRHHDFVVQSAA